MTDLPFFSGGGAGNRSAVSQSGNLTVTYKYVYCIVRSKEKTQTLGQTSHDELSLQVRLVFVIVTVVMTAQTMSFRCELACKGFSTVKA